MLIKKYHKTNLLGKECDILKRCSLIESISCRISSIPQTKFIIQEEFIIYKQELINKQRLNSMPQKSKYQLLLQFSKDLDQMCDYGFVHGDINFSNVLFDGISIKLIDLEPCFHQIKNNQIVVKSSKSFRSLNDYKNKTITTETDKIGFYFICDYFFNEKNQAIFGRNHFVNRAKGNFNLLLQEADLVCLKFNEIFEYLYNCHKNESQTIKFN